MTNLEYPIVIDNILPLNKFFALRDEFRYIGWSLTNRSLSDDDYLSWGWRKNVTPANLLCMYDTAGIIKLKIQRYLKTDLTYIRSHINGQTSGQVSKIHRDYDYSGTYTVVLFTEKNWNTQWGGEFVFFDKDKDEYKYVTYKPNRGVLIPAEQEHYGMSPNPATTRLRTSVAFSYVTDEKLDILLRTNKEPRQFIGPTHGPGF